MGNYWLDRTLKLYSCEGVDYIIAYSLEDAKKVSKNVNGYSDDELEEWDWWTLDEESEFSYEDADGKRDTKKVREWIEEYGEGYFASSEY